MAQRWLIGVIAAFAVIGMAGVGFSAFTATATVNGSASAATMGLKIIENDTVACDWYFNTPGAPGNISFSNENAGQTVISLKVTNMTPGVYCVGIVVLENTGSVPVNVSVAFLTAGANGMCNAFQLNCYGVFTLSGLATDGSIWWDAQPTFGIVTDSYSNFATLQPGGSFVDWIGVDMPAGSTSAPAGGGAFSIVYTASAGI
ncbi:MAG TPA: hypothetical protein VMG36_00940 [Thermoplasmata archaeon]|nr:hypothetical protein [Thermoplasmata archaeon]